MNRTITKLISAIAVLVFSGHILNAQTTHNVTISGFSFSPPSLTIDVGDEVIWTNSTGVGHNVNGTTTTFPSNPESFGNFVGTAWTYSYTFNTAGAYTYQCDPHSGAGMSGQISVNAVTTGIAEIDSKQLRVFPNPAKEEVNFDVSGLDIEEEMVINLYNTLGELVKQVKIGEEQLLTISTVDLSAGVYFYQLQTEAEILEKGKLVVK